MAGLTYTPQSKRLQAARSLWSQSFYDSAVDAYREAIKKEPKNLAAKIDGARALGLSYYHSESEKILKTLVGLAKREPTLLIHAGLVARDIRRPDLAQTYFTSAIDRFPENGEIEVELAQILERKGEFAMALEHVEKALKKQPELTWIETVKARLLGELGKSEKALESYEVVVKSAKTSPGIVARAFLEKARLHDSMGDAELARRSVELGKRIIRSETGPDDSEQSAPLAKARSLAADVPEGFLETCKQRLSEPCESLCFLMGFPRSGTTLIEKTLVRGAAVDDAEELDIFGSRVHPIMVGSLKGYTDLSDYGQKVVSHLRKRYLKAVASALGGRVHPHLIDKNPSNTGLAVACARIFPEAKFLTVIRDPRDVLLSAYFQPLSLNPESVLFADRSRLAHHLVATIETWLEAKSKLPEGSWREVRYEDFVKRPSANTLEIQGWLGLEPRREVISEVLTEGEKGYVHSPSFASVRKAPHSNRLNHWQKHEQWIKGLRPVLEPLMTKLNYSW